MSSHSGKSGVPKAAWLGLGGVLIAGGIAYGVYTSRGDGSSKVDVAKQPDKAVVTTEKPASSGGPGLTDPPKVSGPTAPTGGGGSGQSPVLGGRKGPATPGINKLPGSVSPSTGPAPNTSPPPALAAERFYAQALDFSQKGMPCDGQGAIAQAIQSDPGNTKYRVLQSRLQTGCDVLKQAENNYEQANLKFASGDYCEGKNDIDQAVKSVPGNPKYLALQQRLKKGCNLP